MSSVWKQYTTDKQPRKVVGHLSATDAIKAFRAMVTDYRNRGFKVDVQGTAEATVWRRGKPARVYCGLYVEHVPAPSDKAKQR